jgi:cation diffusion facilitator CzcD-associated flavoprotein CzcO
MTADTTGNDAAIRVQALIIGAGISGLCQAVRMEKAGMDFLVLEKAQDVGGTWRENSYPGACCDVESHLYSYSHDPNPAWSFAFASQPEILTYLRNVARRRGLLARIRFGTEVTAARWDAQACEWVVSTVVGPAYICRFLVLAVGPLHAAYVPELPGVFGGPRWHSSAWNHDVDLKGKHVALIGTGASGIQIAPYLAEKAAGLTIFQRTPAWVLPKANAAVPIWRQRMFRWLPWTQALYRFRIYLRREKRGLGFHYKPGALRVAEPIVLRQIAAQIDDQGLREKLTPDYRLGCKRVLFSSDFYRAVNQPHVHLVARPAVALRPGAVVDEVGDEHKADVVIYATGFEVTGSFDRIRIEGSGGHLLEEAWRDGPRSYHGVLVPSFPNMFILLGPGGVVPYTSVVVYAEAQARYVVQAIRAIRSSRGSAPCSALVVRPEAEQRFQEETRRKYERTVWGAGGCRSWYQTGTPSGTVLWPGSTWSYRWRLRKLRRRDFIVS